MTPLPPSSPIPIPPSYPWIAVLPRHQPPSHSYTSFGRCPFDKKLLVAVDTSGGGAANPGAELFFAGSEREQ